MKSIKLVMAMLVLFIGASAFAADTMQDLRAKFEKRYPQMRALKDQGLIGETSAGYLDVVKGGDSSAKSLVDEDNADRRELYQLIAKKEGTTPEVVAERNGKRNFERAHAGDYLKGPDGQWRKK